MESHLSYPVLAFFPFRSTITNPGLLLLPPSWIPAAVDHGRKSKALANGKLNSPSLSRASTLVVDLSQVFNTSPKELSDRTACPPAASPAHFAMSLAQHGLKVARRCRRRPAV